MTNIDEHTRVVAGDVARRIGEVRKSQGMSQQAVADAMTAQGYEFSRLMVTKTESAGRPTTVADLAAFAKVLGVPVSYFLSEPDDAQTTALDNEHLVVESADVFLEELQATITAERARLAKHSAHLSARRAALGG